MTPLRLPLLFAACALLLTACATIPRPSARDDARLAGRTYVVTGASSGFGRGVARRLGQGRANVVLVARRAELLEEVAGEVRAAGGQALVFPGDVGDPEAIARLADAAVARFGRVDVWINNAGVVATGRFEDTPVADHERIVRTNLLGVVYGTRAALTLFRAQGFGTVVNTGSVESEVPLAYQATYSATKAGVLSLGRAINEELRLAGLHRRIRVATVMPCAANTPIWTHSASYSGVNPRMILLDDAQAVADAIVWTSLHPREEVAVGWKAQGAVLAHRWLPDTTERIAADVAHGVQVHGQPPSPPRPGALHRPMRSGREVSEPMPPPGTAPPG